MLLEQQSLKLLTVNMVYVDPLNGNSGAQQIRDMLIGSLHRTGLFVITEDQEQADAFLRGSAENLSLLRLLSKLRGPAGPRLRLLERAGFRRVRVPIRKLWGRRHPELVPSRAEARSCGRHQAGAPKRRSHLVNHKGRAPAASTKDPPRTWADKVAKDLAATPTSRAEKLARKP